MKMNKMLQRSYSQFYKNTKLLSQSAFRWFDITIYPVILMISLTFFLSYLNTPKEIFSLVIMGIIGWRAVYHAEFEINVNYMEEYWDNSLTHLFITPIRLAEMILGGLLSAILKFTFVTLLLCGMTYYLYGFFIPDMGIFLIAVFFLFIFGITLGMLTFSLLFYSGSNAISLAYAVPDVFVLFSGVYYSISVLPEPLHSIALLLPSTHAFNLLKSSLGFATVDWTALIGLSAIWFIGAALILNYSFRKAKKTGKLVRVA